MKIRKKVLILFLVLAVTVVFTACGNNQETENLSAETQDHTEETQQEASADTDSEVSENPEEEDTDSRILVAYYSNTGTTEEVANTIAEHTGADTAEIERTEEYGNLQDEAEAEIENGEHPEITVSVEDITAYDTIFIGYPIWFDEAPAMIATFLADNNFSGKTIIPFCTSSSDTIDNSLHIFEELCPDALLEEGLTANNTEDIQPWLESMGLMQQESNDE